MSKFKLLGRDDKSQSVRLAIERNEFEEISKEKFLETIRKNDAYIPKDAVKDIEENPKNYGYFKHPKAELYYLDAWNPKYDMVIGRVMYGTFVDLLDAVGQKL